MGKALENALDEISTSSNLEEKIDDLLPSDIDKELRERILAAVRSA